MALALRTRTRKTAKPQTSALDMQAQQARTTVPLNDTIIWYNRCMDLATANRLHATFNGRSVRGIDCYSVPSSSQPGVYHLVKFHTVPRQVECDCIAAKYGRACGHAGAVLLAIDRAERHAAQQSEHMRWWLNTSVGEWDHW